MCQDSTSPSNQVSVVPSCPHKSGCVGTVLQLLTSNQVSVVLSCPHKRGCVGTVLQMLTGSVFFHRVHTRVGVSGQYFNS